MNVFCPKVCSRCRQVSSMRCSRAADLEGRSSVGGGVSRKICLPPAGLVLVSARCVWCFSTSRPCQRYPRVLIISSGQLFLLSSSAAPSRAQGRQSRCFPGASSERYRPAASRGSASLFASNRRAATRYSCGCSLSSQKQYSKHVRSRRQFRFWRVQPS